MVTMMTTTNNNNATNATNGQLAFYNCLSPSQTASFDFDGGEKEEKKTMFLHKLSSSNESVNNNNDRRWIRTDSIDINHDDDNDDDGRNNNLLDEDGNVLDSNYHHHHHHQQQQHHSSENDDDDDETISQKEEKCNRSRLRTLASVTAAAKQRAKSADVTTTIDDYYNNGGVGGRYPIFNFDSLAAGDGESSSSTTSTTAFRQVPTCKALRMAVLALYRLDDFDRTKIGQGFFSEVFKVCHKVTGEQLALKLNTMSSNRPNVLREVQTMRRLKHPNVLRFRGVCVDKGQLHALSEYCNGGSLEQLIKGGGTTITSTGSCASLAPFPWLVRSNLAADIARGMQYVHACGYIHRDLTSKNVLLKRDDCGRGPSRYTAIIADFGLSCKIPKPITKLAAVGTPYWMAPECLNDELYTEISDVFSYGIILCEMIARIDADPDFMPRTSTFGLDYVRFSELCPLDTPVDFLKLAFRCCLMDPNSRPNFDQIVQLALNLVSSLQDPTITPLSSLQFPRQISHILTTNGASPVHYATIANTPSSTFDQHHHDNHFNNQYQRFLSTNSGVGVGVQFLTTPIKLIRSHSDMGISGGGGGESDEQQTTTTTTTIIDDEQHLSQSPSSSAMNRALAHRFAGEEDPFYKAPDEGDFNPFAGDRRFAGGRKIVTDSCYASPSILRNLDAPPTSSALLGNSAVLSVANNEYRRFTIWKQSQGMTVVPIRRSHSLPSTPILSSSAVAGQANGNGGGGGFLYVDVKELGGDHCSSDEQQPQKAAESPNHVQVRRVTQVFEEQDKLFVDNRQKQKKSMKKALTLSAVDGRDCSPPLLFCSDIVDVNGRRDESNDDCQQQQPVVMVGGASLDGKRAVKRVKRFSRRHRKRKDIDIDGGDNEKDEDESNVDPSCGGSLQNTCSLL